MGNIFLKHDTEQDIEQTEIESKDGDDNVYSLTLSDLYGDPKFFPEKELPSNFAELLFKNVSDGLYMINGTKISKHICYLVAGKHANNGIINVKQLHKLGPGMAFFEFDFRLFIDSIARSNFYNKTRIESKYIKESISNDIIKTYFGKEYILIQNSRHVYGNNVAYYAYRAPSFKWTFIPINCSAQ